MTVICLRGSSKLGLVKNRVYPVLDLIQLGADFGHQIRIVLQLTDRRRTLYIPTVFKNRLRNSNGFNVHNGGDPTRKARLALQGEGH